MLTIASVLEDVRRADNFVVDACHRHCGFAGVRDAIRLSVTEIITNVIEHGYRMEPDHQVRVCAGVVEDAMQIRISDDAPPMPDAVLEMICVPDFDRFDLTSLPERGWGLYICKSQMDALEYRSVAGVNTFVLTKKAAMT